MNGVKCKIQIQRSFAIWAGLTTLVHLWRGISPPFFYERCRMSVLSVFVDESGDFGDYDANSPYYIVSLVFHDQRNTIDEHICSLNEHLAKIEFHEHRIHTGPLVRREGVYKHLDVKKRRQLFYAIFNFARKCPFSYTILLINKRQCESKEKVLEQLTKIMTRLISSLSEEIVFFEEVMIYYDNGQVELSKVIHSAVSEFPHKFQIRKIEPEECKRYKLSQVADLVCTIELVEQKRQTNGLSKSESIFFGKERDFQKNYLRQLRLKRKV